MKKQLYFGILTTYILLFSLKLNAQDTIPLMVTPPAQTGFCLDNNFSVSFEGQGLHEFTIQAQLWRNNTIDNVFNCTPAIPKPKLFIKVDSVSTPYTESTDTLGGSWTGQFSSTDTITIWYHVYLDCSSIEPGNSNTTNLNLVQTFTDANNFVYNTGNGINTHQVSNLPGFRIIAPNNPQFNSSYLDTTFLTFYYINPASGSAVINFSFAPDTSDYCGMLNYTNLQYAVGANGTFQIFSANNLTTVSLFGSDTLIVRQKALIDTCISICNNAKVFFHWQCAQSPSTDSIFCNNCTGTITTNFTIKNNNNPKIRIERVSPSYGLAQYDPSCFNDTINMRDWHFRITNFGEGAIDSVWIDLLSTDVIASLGLIPRPSFYYQSTCGNCIDSVSLVSRTNYLCQNFIPDALASASLQLKNFGEQNTIDIYFETFRCASENNLLFNVIKSVNDVQLKVRGTGICSDTAALDLFGTPFFYFTHTGAIAGVHDNDPSDLKLNTIFTPLGADLTVPNDSTFGQTATLEINFDGGINGIDRQVLGCMSTACTNLEGYLKAVITCEQGLIVRDPGNDVRIKLYNTNAGNYHFLDPIYFHTLVPLDSCLEGAYSYYFDLSNPIFKNVLDSGVFEFTLQSCCQAIPVTDYTIAFSILPNPSNCDSLNFPTGNTLPPNCSGTGCAWIPLNTVENHFSVHCPGCVTPGMVVDNYIFRRTTFGLQDGDNNGLADSGAVSVTPGSPWFDDHNIKTWHSTVGDELEDILVSHFQQGDATTTGYTYQQMIDSAGVRLPFLQLCRDIPKGLDTMKVNPVKFTLYIDVPDNINFNCLNCELFSVDSLRYRTILAIHVPDSMLSSYLDLYPVTNKYLYSFESRYDSSTNQYTGNLHDTPALIIHTDTTAPFIGFFENQQYRLHVTYEQCGTKITTYGNLFTLETIAKQVEIQNKMWLSGIKQGPNAFGNIPNQPGSLAELDSAGWTLDPNDSDTTLTLIDSTFASGHIFYCTGYGKFHYFFYQNIQMNAGVANDTSCFKMLSFSSHVKTKGVTIKAFPFEYRPTPFWHNEIDVTVPSGYFISQARYRSGYYVGPVGITSTWQTFTSPAIIGNFTMRDSSYMKPLCNMDPYINNNSAFSSSEATSIWYEFVLTPDSCKKSPLIYADSSVVFHFGLTDIPCITGDSSLCQPHPSIDWPSAHQLSQILVTEPNLSGFFISDTLVAENHQVCFDFVITNFTIPLDSPATVSTTGAAHVFLALPDSMAIPFLQNWVYYGNNGDTTFAIGGMIPLDSYLLSGDSLSGQICAYYTPCQDTVSIPFHIGWNCDGYPVTPFDADSVCGASPLSVVLTNQPVSVIPVYGKQHPDTYTLCKPFEIETEYKSVLFGGYLPHQVVLDSVAGGLLPLYAFITNCNDSSSTIIDTLQFSTPESWTITAGNLATIGIADSTLNLLECIKITIGFLPTCAFAGIHSLPAMILLGETFCGDTLSVTAAFTGTFQQDMDSSLCTDCFSIEKMALQDTVFVGDTATFQIVVCGTNALSQTLVFSDLLPPGFTPLLPVPDSVAVPDIGCDTLFISGTFSQSGFCSDSTMWNTATIYFSGDSQTSQACINVYPECVAGLPFFSVPDSSFSSTYPSTVMGQNLFLEGRLYVDNILTLNNCTIFVNTGGQIIILPGGSLILDSTIIQGCDFMWQGIMTDTLTSVAVTYGSTIRDANRAVEARDGSTIKITHSSFEDNVWGIYVPANSSGNNIPHAIYGNRFGLFATSLKQAYPGQTPFGIVPYAGIEVNDVVMTIGSLGADSNWFYKMNMGVIGHRSALLVQNNKFSLVQTDTSITSPEPWDGTAITSLGKLNSVAGKLTVGPVNSGAWSVENCRQGVYTDYSDLDVRRVDMTGVETGVASRHCTDMLTSLVEGCKIETRRFGIDWRLNAGSGGMRALGNFIYNTGNSSVGILMRENNLSVDPVYQVSANYVECTDGAAAIAGLRLYGAEITWNIVKVTGTASPEMHGITVQSNDSSSVSCNNVGGDDESDTLKTAYSVNISDRTQVTCNVADSTGNGFSFGGIAPSSYRGNVMKRHFVGLYLNNVAVIDTQTHAGNRWTGSYSSGYGAVNMNAAQPSELVKSLFVVDPNLGTVFNPDIPLDDNDPPFYVDNTGWFDPVPGNTFDCGSAGFCISSFMGGGSEELRMSIVSGDTLTVEYIPESKTMARQYLFEQLKTDSILLDSKTEYQAFVSNHENQNIGYLYEVKKSLTDIVRLSQIEKQTFASVDSLIKFYTDSILATDSLALADIINSYVAVRSDLISQLRTQISLREALLQARWVNNNTLLTTAQIKNNLISGGDDPVFNEKTVNDLSIQYLLYGKGGIASHYSTLLGVAVQCPYKGGKAVYRARVLVSLFNDTIVYDDAAVCLQEGIYRSLSSNQTSKRSLISIRPNPASEKVEIVLHETYEGVCSVQILNAFGKAALRSEFNCTEKKQTMDISTLAPGAYIVTVWINRDFNVHQKLVVIR